MPFRFVDHTADVAVLLSGHDAAELLRAATAALAAIYLESPDDFVADEKRCEERAIELEAPDGESLLVDYLNELIYLFDTAGFLAWRLDVKELDLHTRCRLVGCLVGRVADSESDAFKTEVKAATHHQLRIREDKGRLTATLVFDL